MVIQSAVLSAKGATNVFKLGLSVSCVHAVLHMLALVNKGITQEDKGGKDIIQEDKGDKGITQEDKDITQEDKGDKDITQEVRVAKGITQGDREGKDITQGDKGALDITQDGLGVAAKVVPAFQVLIVTPWSKESPS